MSLKIKVIGIGAAGNKAAIQLIKDRVLNRDSVLLLNSTARDIPEEYKTDLAIEFGNTRGCGKERELAKQLIVDALRERQVPIDSFIEGDEKFFVIVSSTEGGTGSGASVVLGEYLQQITGAPVHMVAFTGFEDDARGLKNTVDWFNDLNEQFIVQVISNKKCLPFVENNRKRAEEYANRIFSQRISTMIGINIIPSDSNIDSMDLFKLNASPGYMTVEKVTLEKIRTSQDFNTQIKQALANSVSLESDQSVKRLGVIINASKKIMEVVDDSFDVIKDAFGFPLELFRQNQNDGNEDYVQIIASGMKMPIDDIKETYAKFQKQRDRIDLDRDNFFNSKGKFNTHFTSTFDIGSKPSILTTDPNKLEANKNNFFTKYAALGATKTGLGKGIIKDEL